MTETRLFLKRAEQVLVAPAGPTTTHPSKKGHVMDNPQSTDPARNNHSVEYRDIPGWPGYRAGSDGSIWTCRGQGAHRGKLTRRWLRMKSRAAKSGHLFLVLSVMGKQRCAYVHTLVLEAFVGPRPEGMECRHYPDQNPANNAIDNLRWDTPLNNQRDRKENGTAPTGGKPVKLTADGVKEIRRLVAAGVNHRQAAERFGVSRSLVGMIVNRKVWASVD